MNKNLSFHLRSKYIDVRYYYVRNVLNVKSLELAKIHTDKNISDMLTKVVKMEKHVFCRDGMGMEALSLLVSASWSREGGFVG